MQLRIRARHLDVPLDTRLAIERKIRLALGRHASSIHLADVTLSAGGNGSRCRIRLRLRHGEDLAVEGLGEDPRAAAVVAAWRLEQRLERRRAVLPAGGTGPRRLGLG